MLHIIQRVGNWRFYDSEAIGIKAEIKGPDGVWRWLDCAWVCKYCGECLGCLRKVILIEDYETGRFSIDRNEVICAHSPNGLHWYDLD